MLCVKPSNLTTKCLVPSMEHKHSQDGVGGGGDNRVGVTEPVKLTF